MKILTISDDETMTIRRIGRGRGFCYKDENDDLVQSKDIIKRIRSLVIPPMWSEVFISNNPNAHIQAIGRDLRNRKQYIYHPLWSEKQQKIKFEKLLTFVDKLPEFRDFCLKNLKQREFTREKVLSIICLTLDEYGIRVGNTQYAKENESFGLSTLRRKHISLEDGEMHLKFKGKSKQYLDISIEDPKLAKLIRDCSEKPGYEIFKYKENGSWIDVDSQDINEFIHKHLCPDISSKFFRTWVACRNTVELYSEAVKICEENPRKKFMPTLISLVANSLGNTVTVCRKYYIHPKILKAAEKRKIPIIPPEEHVISCTFSQAEKIAISLIR